MRRRGDGRGIEGWEIIICRKHDSRFFFHPCFAISRTFFEFRTTPHDRTKELNTRRQGTPPPRRVPDTPGIRYGPANKMRLPSEQALEPYCCDTILEHRVLVVYIGFSVALAAEHAFLFQYILSIPHEVSLMFSLFVLRGAIVNRTKYC